MQTKLLINGQLVAGEGEKLAVLYPSLGTTLVEIAEATPAQVDAAVQAADAAFDNWSQTAPKDRSLLLLKLADTIDALRETRHCRTGSRLRPWQRSSHQASAAPGDGTL